MKVWQLQADERLLEEAYASYVTKSLGVISRTKSGKMHVTDQRVAFTDVLTLFFDYPLSRVVSFSAGIMNTITLTTDDGKNHRITGMFNRKLIAALEEAGVKKA